MEGKLVRLRAYERTDVDALMRLVNDEELKRYFGVDEPLKYPLSRFQEEKWVEYAMANSGPDRIFAIETLATREFIGQIALHQIHWIDRRANLSIQILDKTFWSKGYGTDALLILERLVFDKLGLHRLALRCAAENARAIRCYEKCGFRQEGVMRGDRLLDGRRADSLMMSILEPEYRALMRAHSA
ncbi:MAG TPA: GNAT family protein [Candidatus Binataceae bacterium]|nr:GNAT family protein [Candidatus Binataceae bacterium]